MEHYESKWIIILVVALVTLCCYGDSHAQLAGKLQVDGKNNADNVTQNITENVTQNITDPSREQNVRESQMEWQPVGCSKHQWLDNMGMCNTTEYQARMAKVREMKRHLAAFMNMTIQEAEGEPIESLYIEEDELVLPNQAEAYSRGAREILEEDNRKRKKRKITNFPSYPIQMWPLPIKYKIDNTFSDRELGHIDNAIQMYSSGTCIQFQKLQLDESEPEQHLLFTKTKLGCYSYIGRADPDFYDVRPQPLFLSFQCFATSGYVAHELGHALGLFHEHQRPDRDDYIRVVRENVKDTQAGNFSPVTQNLIDYLGVPYDLTSGMHYRANAFSKGTLPTIETKDPLYQRTIGQRVELSFSDLKIVNKAYCSDQCWYRLSRACSHQGYQDPQDCSRCRCPDGWAGRYCEDLAPSTTYQCGGERRAETYAKYLSSPGYSQDIPYEDLEQCNWLITAPVGRRIVIEFVGDFSIYCFADRCRHWVEVRYKGDLGLPGPRFCCKERPAAMLTSDRNQVLIHFKTPTETLSLNKKGFQIAYRIEGFVPEPFLMEVDMCQRRPCQNGGVCYREWGGRYRCACLNHWQGQNCTYDSYDACKEQRPCLNGGECLKLPNRQYSCRCSRFWAGPSCNERVRDYESCRVNPCSRGGTCVQQRSGGYTCLCPPYVGGVNCTQHERPIDLTILMDSGGYAGKDWRRMTEFVRNLLANMAMGSQYTQVGLITFNREARLKASLNDRHGIQGITDKLYRTSSDYAEAYIYKALWLMENELFSTTRNHGDRADAMNIALVVTDSGFPLLYPGTRDAVQRVAQQARDKDIGLLVVGVGNRVNVDELYSISENTDNIFLCDRYQDLDSPGLLQKVRARLKFLGEHPQEIHQVNSGSAPERFRYTTTTTTTSTTITTTPTTTTTTTTHRTTPTTTTTPIIIQALTTTTSYQYQSSQTSTTPQDQRSESTTRSRQMIGCTWRRSECSRPCGGCGKMTYSMVCFYDDQTEEISSSFDVSCNGHLCRRVCQTVSSPLLVGGQIYEGRYSSSLQCSGQLCCHGYRADINNNRCVPVGR